jgi:cytochrome c peroxidase
MEQAVQGMAYFQLGRKLSDDEVGKIVAFLRTLSGELPESVR